MTWLGALRLYMLILCKKAKWVVHSTLLHKEFISTKTLEKQGNLSFADSKVAFPSAKQCPQVPDKEPS